MSISLLGSSGGDLTQFRYMEFGSSIAKLIKGNVKIIMQISIIVRPCSVMDRKVRLLHSVSILDNGETKSWP